MRSVDRVRDYLKAKGIESEVIEFPQSTKTAKEAAEAICTTVAQIVKSLILLADGRPILALVSGDRRVDMDKMTKLLGVGSLRMADADTVRRETGFAIGGVPPIAHKRELPTYIDANLMRHRVVYAAAGAHNAVFPISPQDLRDLTGGKVEDFTR
ncbi:MAG: YbaK/EbsC family protein [bacterium]